MPKGESPVAETLSRCPKCGGEPHLTPSKIARRDYSCRACLRERNRRFKSKNHERVSEYNKQWKAAHPDAVKRYQATRPSRWIEPDPVKVKARAMVATRLRSGKILRRPCERCASAKTQAHHDDYSRPLDIRWLCAKCHRAVHMEMEARDAA